MAPQRRTDFRDINDMDRQIDRFYASRCGIFNLFYAMTQPWEELSQIIIHTVTYHGKINCRTIANECEVSMKTSPVSPYTVRNVPKVPEIRS